ncbi:MAG: hypothetical protein ACR2P8_00125 [Myxococcota bacterium]
MTRKLIAPIVIALALGALPASAASRHDDDDRQRGRRYAAIRGDVHEHEAKIAALTNRLDRATTELVSEAATRGHRLGWKHWRAFHALQRLERKADRYQEIVAHRGAGSRRADAAFEELECAFQDAMVRRHDLRRKRHLRDELSDVARLMEKLDRRNEKLDQALARLDRREDRRRYSRERREDDRYTRRGGNDRDWHVAFQFGF